MALLPKDVIKLDDDGNAPGFSEQIEALRKSDGYLFDEGTKSNYTPAGGEPGAYRFVSSHD